MNNINYNNELKKIIEQNVKNGVNPKLLLHSCCAPCSTTCLERLKAGFDITAYYYNPNINDEVEYDLRAKELQKLCDKFNVKCIVEDFDSSGYNSAVRGYEDAKEGGERCFICFSLRLRKTMEKAEELGCDYFATSLTLSPLKNASRINEIGDKICSGKSVKYLATDFKKDGGYLRSIELSKEYDLYRQNYCGCEFSKR